ncbi:MAG: cytochrome c biogenesis protein CcdA [Burkholderiales bacterium]|nr:cytochrome c biogenesis protein CcdA [Burkholderiales bacterium]
MITASALGLATAFLAGIVSFLSPCVLPLVPGYVSFIAGQSAEPRHFRISARLSTLGISAFFVAGFASVFIALGASASAMGELLSRYRYELNILGGVVVIAFGLLMLGMIRGVPWLQRDLRFHPRIIGGSPITAYVLGLAFGFGWTPCIGPVLGAILMVSSTGTSAGGVGLLTAYALGLGAPFLVTALFLDRAAKALRHVRRLGQILQLVGGLLMIAMGVAMMTGQLAVFAYWLLEIFPALGTIG